VIDETQAADQMIAEATAAVRYYVATHPRSSNLSDTQYLAHVRTEVFGYHPYARWLNESKTDAEMTAAAPIAEATNV